MDSRTPDAVNTSIFDLPECVLHSVLAAACQEPITAYSVRLSQRTGVEGICGEYLTAVFRAETDRAREVEIPMFIRRQRRACEHRRQAHHYTYLTANGVPVPLLYGSHVDSQGREIILLELLDEAGAPDDVLLARQDYLEDYFHLAAALAAVQLTDDHVGRLGYELAGRDFVMNWGDWLPWSAHILRRIESHAETGDLGDSLKEYCSKNSPALARLRRTCLPLMHAVRASPLGLVHGDFRPGNTGRRRLDRQLVLYDLEDLSIDARFYDVAQILGGPRPLLAGTDSNNELAEFFLDIYADRSGQRLALEVFLGEARLAWAARKINLWEYLPPSVGGPPYDQQAFVGDKVERSEKLSSTLAQLVESLDHVSEAMGRAS
jgi:hypothetical protein